MFRFELILNKGYHIVGRFAFACFPVLQGAGRDAEIFSKFPLRHTAGDAEFFDCHNGHHPFIFAGICRPARPLDFICTLLSLVNM